MVRDFRRKYNGDNRNLVLDDTLYCLALMQHHGAPTRLLDWTYSPFVAAYFALELESEKPESCIWCVNEEWCRNTTESIVPGIHLRNVDDLRKDWSFDLFYRRLAPQRFVFPENPLLLNQRQIIQQGIFLCPGNVFTSFKDNLQALTGWQDSKNLIKLKLNFDSVERKKALDGLYRMNVSRATLFPGLDGFAKSLCQRLPFYEEMAKRQTGKSIVTVK